VAGKITQTASKKWFILAFASVLLAAPNGSVIKIVLEQTNTFTLITYRYLLVLIITLPLLIKYAPTLTRKNIRTSLSGGIYMSISLLTFVLAINMSQVSYVSILMLLAPLMLIVFSNRIIGEKISRRGIAGITLAAIGAMLIVVLPVALSQFGEFVFYPEATILTLINCVTFSLATIRYRQANEAGLSFGPILAITAIIAVALHGVIGLVMYGPSSFQNLSTEAIIGIIYSGIVVGLIARVISVAAYERIGSVASGGFAYIEMLLAILLPVLWLNEKLSIEMTVGGILILIGVYVAEHHKSLAHKHFHFFRHH
jgi:drug/metabolite transporter (DMT)-like permease